RPGRIRVQRALSGCRGGTAFTHHRPPPSRLAASSRSSAAPEATPTTPSPAPRRMPYAARSVVFTPGLQWANGIEVLSRPVLLPASSRASETPAATATTAIPESQRMLYAYRSVVFNGELQDENGMEIISRLVLLSAEDPSSDIHLWINSPGGSVPMMHAIADVIATVPNDIVTIAFGWAASAGQFVLTSGTPGKRLALPHAR